MDYKEEIENILNESREDIRESVKEKYICIKEDGKPFAYRFIFPRLMKSMPIRDYRVNEYLEYIEKENV